MAIAIQQISPVAHLPWVQGVVRKLNVAALIDTFCPPHPAHGLSCGRGVEALLLAILDGHHALYKPTVSLLMIPLVYCHINSFQRASSMEKPFPGGENRIDGRASHHVEW
jgi:hypothetical protein